MKTSYVEWLWCPFAQYKDNLLSPGKIKTAYEISKRPSPGVYKIPCICSDSYIGQTGRAIAVRIKEHQRHLRLWQLDKAVVAHQS